MPHALPTRRSPWRRALAALLLAVSGPALAQPADVATLRVLVLESQGRALPTQAAAALQQLRGQTDEFSPQRLELLTVQGLMHALASQPEAAQRAAEQLAAWGRQPQAAHAAHAAAAAMLVRARSMARDGRYRPPMR